MGYNMDIRLNATQINNDETVEDVNSIQSRSNQFLLSGFRHDYGRPDKFNE